MISDGNQAHEGAGPGKQLHVAEGIHLFPMLIIVHVRRNFEI